MLKKSLAATLVLLVLTAMTAAAEGPETVGAYVFYPTGTVSPWVNPDDWAYAVSTPGGQEGDIFNVENPHANADYMYSHQWPEGGTVVNPMNGGLAGQIDGRCVDPYGRCAQVPPPSPESMVGGPSTYWDALYFTDPRCSPPADLAPPPGESNVWPAQQ